MKKITLILLCIGMSVSGYSQFAQMLETMLQQIAALEAYLKTAEKGYQIAEQGLHTISEIKNGEFNLHSVFFGSLKTVNPKVGQMAEVAEVVALQISLAEQIKNALQAAHNNKWLTPDEISYIAKVYSTILTAVSNDLTDLINVTSDGKLEMTDGERITRIAAIDKDMRTQSGLVQDFSRQVDLLSVQRQQQSSDLESVKTFYGIP